MRVFEDTLKAMQFVSPNLVVIAVCARPFVTAAARLGYRVATFDMFNDVDTRRFSFSSAQVAFSCGGFDAEDLWRKLSLLDPDALVGVTYGSGLENQPELLEKISRRFSLLGNSPEVVASMKDPRRFFPLLDALGVMYPEVRFDAPGEGEGWLVKSAGGSGGTYIRSCDAQLAAGDYCQRKVEGRPVSILFLADGASAEIVGFNEQWLAPTIEMPFRYGGAVGNINLPECCAERMAQAARAVTAAAGLRGLNSMDFLLDGEDELALEVNPRLSATFDLYDVPDLFERHLRACRGELSSLPSASHASKAHLVMYASRDMTIPGMLDWPVWTADLPPAETLLKAGEPLCTVLAQAPDAEAAKSLIFARAHQLKAQLWPLQLFGNP
ncbi:MAG TPA: ATP-grasp domain-containing protein [Methylophilaceae bacterium]|nr:ATP-grasp domain-containing protein [Methylophilaceae bacterium]